MDVENLIKNLVELISIKSLSGYEFDALKKFEEICPSLDKYKERICVSESRYNLFYSIGNPVVVFTTHIDVVDGDDSLFSPYIEEDSIMGRGACDAKGSLIAMLGAIENLIADSKNGFGLLVVVGEEDDGIGAKVAAKELKNRGIKYLINGEPTENYLAENTGGVFDLICKFEGKSVHSGYPENGDNANSKLLKACYNIENLSKDLLNDAEILSINIGYINAGIAGSIISSNAELRACIRTNSLDNEKAISLIKQCLNNYSEYKVSFNSPYKELYVLPDFPKKKIKFASDIPNFENLASNYLMYGPGTIMDAHTNLEKIKIKDLTLAVDDYIKIFNRLA